MCRFSVHARGGGGERRGDGEAGSGERAKERGEEGAGGGEISQMVGIESQEVRQGVGLGKEGRMGGQWVGRGQRRGEEGARGGEISQMVGMESQGGGRQKGGGGWQSRGGEEGTRGVDISQMDTMHYHNHVTPAPHTHRDSHVNLIQRGKGGEGIGTERRDIQSESYSLYLPVQHRVPQLVWFIF